METMVVNTQDGDFLGYIETDVDTDILNDIIAESFEKNNDNYDIDCLISDIVNAGYSADRVYLEEIEI